MNNPQQEQKTKQENQIENKPLKTFKQSPEVRKYFNDYHTKRRLRLAKCTECGGHAEYKKLDSKKKLCEVCIMRAIIKKNKEAKEKEMEKQTVAMPVS
jgi:hypothetical protein